MSMRVPVGDPKAVQMGSVEMQQMGGDKKVATTKVSEMPQASESSTTGKSGSIGKPNSFSVKAFFSGLATAMTSCFSGEPKAIKMNESPPKSIDEATEQLKQLTNPKDRYNFILSNKKHFEPGTVLSAMNQKLNDAGSKQKVEIQKEINNYIKENFDNKNDNKKLRPHDFSSYRPVENGKIADKGLTQSEVKNIIVQEKADLILSNKENHSPTEVLNAFSSKYFNAKGDKATSIQKEMNSYIEKNIDNLSNEEVKSFYEPSEAGAEVFYVDDQRFNRMSDAQVEGLRVRLNMERPVSRASTSVSQKHSFDLPKAAPKVIPNQFDFLPPNKAEVNKSGQGYLESSINREKEIDNPNQAPVEEPKMRKYSEDTEKPVSTEAAKKSPIDVRLSNDLKTQAMELHLIIMMDDKYATPKEKEIARNQLEQLKMQGLEEGWWNSIPKGALDSPPEIATTNVKQAKYINSTIVPNVLKLHLQAHNMLISQSERREAQNQLNALLIEYQDDLGNEYIAKYFQRTDTYSCGDKAVDIWIAAPGLRHRVELIPKQVKSGVENFQKTIKSLDSAIKELKKDIKSLESQNPIDKKLIKTKQKMIENHEQQKGLQQMGINKLLVHNKKKMNIREGYVTDNFQPIDDKGHIAPSALEMGTINKIVKNDKRYQL